MTQSAFDPICFGQYPKDNVPLLLHFEFEGSSDIYRYVQVERIPVSEIDAATRRKKDEGPSAEGVRDKYLKKPEPPKVVVPKPPKVEDLIPVAKKKKRGK